MIKLFKRIIITALVLIVLAVGASALVMSPGCSAKEGDPFANAKNSIANAAIDLTGTKGNIEAKARDKAHEIAENWGLTTATADGIIDSLAIQDWRATSLPADVTAIGTHTFEKDGMTLQVTLYDDPTIATVSMYGLAVTMAVPESAQGYVRLASLI